MVDKMPKIIIFDLAEVILQGLVGVDEKISKATGVKEENVGEHLRGEKLVELFKGDISEEEYWDRVIKEGNYDDAPDFFMNAVRDNFKEIPGTKDIIRKLKDKGYRLILLSDHTKEWIEHIESNFSFLNLFDERYYSFDSKKLKELSEGSFQYVLGKTGANPEETLFIDDREINLEFAKKAGIRYIYQFTDAKKLKEDLKNFGIVID